MTEKFHDFWKMDKRCESYYTHEKEIKRHLLLCPVSNKMEINQGLV
jgi:hypothetical protein